MGTGDPGREHCPAGRDKYGGLLKTRDPPRTSYSGSLICTRQNYGSTTDGYLLIHSNAGIPSLKGERIVYPETLEGILEGFKALADMGVNIIGGCCGTGPEHITELSKSLKELDRGFAHGVCRREPSRHGVSASTNHLCLCPEAPGTAEGQSGATIIPNPEYGRPYFVRGNAYLDTGEYADAIADYTKAIELSGEDAMAYNNRGIAHRSVGDLDSAIEDFTQALELDPDYRDAYNNRGLALSDRGEYGVAIEDYTRAIEIDPTSWYAYNNRGLALWTVGEREAAAADYERVRSMIAPDLPASR